MIYYITRFYFIIIQHVDCLECVTVFLPVLKVCQFLLDYFVYCVIYFNK